ncbi:MAG: hypothetical protein HQL65_09470 [Magnetococcales bacterium]|nr:hypothetical protein [Magnetococcales bacterium]
MKLLYLLSGEGPADMGACAPHLFDAMGQDFHPGPMAALVDCVVKQKLNDSPLDSESVRLLHRSRLVELAKKIKIRRQNAVLSPGKRDVKHFERQAQALGQEAQAWGSREDSARVMAVLFNDSDGTSSSPVNFWKLKVDSIRRGFEMAGYRLGVPMVPNPKSEAWLLCAWKVNPYQGCQKLEESSGNDASPNSLKKKLEEAMGETWDCNKMTDWIRQGHLQIDRIKMESFVAFYTDLTTALERATHREGHVESTP